MLFCVLLVALDQTILSTALPRIASDFDSFKLQGWAASSFVLAQSVFLPFFGQSLRIFSAKSVMLVGVAVFEIGSVVCGAAQNMGTLIAGRTISGLGSAGMFVALLLITSQITRIEDRPKYMGTMGGAFGLSSIIGPLIGGGLTEHATWRWCFFLNLPVGGVAIVAVAFLLKAAPPAGSDPTKRSHKDLLSQVRGIDWIGTVLVAGAVTSLVLALQWGGNIKPWKDTAVIVTLVLAGVIAVIFVLWERRVGDRAMVPVKIFKSRSIYAIIMFSFFNRFCQLLFSYYIPIFYQVARHHSPTNSGIDLLPFLLAFLITAGIAGFGVSKTGYYYPFLVASPIVLAIGSGLMYSISTSTSNATLIGFQILVGMGVGLGMQNALVAIQVEFKDHPTLLAQAQSVTSFGQFLGGMVGVGVGEPVFAFGLTKYLARYAPDAPAEIIKNAPTAIYSELPAQLVPHVVRAYVDSLRVVFLVGVPAAGFGLLAVLFISNIKIEKTVTAVGDAEKGGGDHEL
ncbi:MFS general substrate transporter [Mycena rebaudengoi]|nr:MFS general substrate transporter [Mycena rebaudengoi]